MSQATSVQHADYANIDVREWNMDITKEARKDDQISTKKNDQTHRPDEEEVQKEEKQKVNSD